MVADPTRIYDGFETLAAGVNAGRRAGLIEKNQCYAALNAVFRGGCPTTRPGFRKRVLTFLNEIYYDSDGDYSETEIGGQSSEARFKAGVFQGAEYFSPRGMAERIIAMIDGRLFEITPKNEHAADVLEIKLDRRNSASRTTAYLCQADRFMVIQDGESKAIIYDGVNARRSDEIPIGEVMAYGMGRLVVARTYDVYFGDLFGSHPGDPGESVLKFTEHEFLNEGGAASIAFSALGKIKALIFTPQQDSATGDGELLLMAERGFVSLFLSTPREEWKQSAFQRVSLLGTGVYGHLSPTVVNGDAWFRANDGWRTYRQARAEIQGWAHLPLSTEIRQHTETDTPWMLDITSAINFDNRLIGTRAPRPNQGRPYCNGLVALDFFVLSSFGEASKPAWDGAFSDLRTTQLLAGIFGGQERAFAFHIDDDDENALDEITKKDRRDSRGRITAQIDTRALHFDQPFNEKHLYGADIWYDDVAEDVDVVVSYRPDQRTDWVEWGSHTVSAAGGPVQQLTVGGVPTIRKGFSPRTTLPKPDNDIDDTHTDRLMRRFYEVQVRIRWTGHASIRRLRVHAKTQTEESKHRNN